MTTRNVNTQGSVPRVYKHAALTGLAKNGARIHKMCLAVIRYVKTPGASTR